MASAAQQAQFIHDYRQKSFQASTQTGVLPSVILAQWADETGWGTSSAFTSGHNFAGISFNGVSSFPNQDAGLQAYIQVLNHHTYDSVRAARSAPDQAAALGRSPWAQSHYDMQDYLAAGSPSGSWNAPRPGIDLQQIINAHNLTQWDGGAVAAPPTGPTISPDIGTPSGQRFEPLPPGTFNSVGDLVLSGKRLADAWFRSVPSGTKLADLVLSENSEVDLTTTQVSQVVLEFADPEFGLLGEALVMINQDVSWLGMPWLVAVAETTSNQEGGRVKVTMRAKGAQRLKQQWGQAQWVDTSPTDLLAALVHAAGLGFVGQGSPVWPTITRMDPTLGGQTWIDYASGQYLIPQTTWDLGQQLAAYLGFVAFEAAGTYYFGRPSWLVNNMPVVEVAWPPKQNSDGRLWPIQAPIWRRSADDLNGLALIRNIDASTLTLWMDHAAGEMIRPGYALNFDGINPLISGLYMVVGVTWKLDNATAGVQVQCERPIDPIPQLPGDLTGGGGPLNMSGQPARAAGTASALDFTTLALQQTGKRYVWGASDPSSDPNPQGFDCSALVQWCAARLGVSLPRVSGDQWRACSGHAVRVSSALRIRGALLFVDNASGPGGQHVAISLGDGANVIEALNERYGVGSYPASWTPFNRAGLIPQMDYGFGAGAAPPGLT